MGALSENRIKFNKPNLRLIENRINKGEFTKEAYLPNRNALGVRESISQICAKISGCLPSRA